MPDTKLPLQAFGFSIPVTPAGRRVWPPRFKRFVVQKMEAGELTVRQVMEECQVSKSFVYQWRMQAKGKPVTAADWRPRQISPRSLSRMRCHRRNPTGHVQKGICISGTLVEITLPADYPVADLVQIIQSMEASAQ
ncbi:hypothetical protein C9E81_22075 [Paracoccus alkanivorans]|uniref:Transposase n=1 Tax=Paracoccus alkanivorans TaxID=2116655 RepID=A0A3M0LXN9_9RHOB|nr:hypothetical protein C9E81_22075 [Paracoccus alkanivorans]